MDPAADNRPDAPPPGDQPSPGDRLADTAATEPEAPPHLVTRRSFLLGAGASAAAAAATVGILAGGRVAYDETRPQPPPTQATLHGIAMPQYVVPTAPATPPAPDVLRFFTADEAKLVEAITARLLPGTPDDPGAREAGVTTYIDALLAYNDGFAEPAYFQAPFAKTYEGQAPPASPTPSVSPRAGVNPAGQPAVVWVQKQELDRYGYQSHLTPAGQYRAGLGAVDAYARAKFGKKFVDLSEGQQDQLLGDMEAGKATGFTEPTDKGFFKLLRDDTIQGMFCDPLYGGNRGLVGWKLVGYPGAQRGYTPHDLHTEGTRLQPQGMAQLMPLAPGYPAGPGQPILPVSGSDHDHH